MLSWPGNAPLADRGIDTLPFAALDIIDRLPLAVPTDCGANNTRKLALCPGLNVTGGLMPVTLNPAPFAEIWDTVKADPPAFEIFSDKALLPPVGTVPKLREF